MVSADEDPPLSEAEHPQPESSFETDQEDVPTKEPPQPPHALDGDVSAGAKSDSTYCFTSTTRTVDVRTQAPVAASVPASVEVAAKPAAEIREPHPSPSPKDVERAVKTEQDTQDAERTKKRQNLVTRTLWTFIMIGGFLG
jgi:phosphatidate cytidylyltransferase